MEFIETDYGYRLPGMPDHTGHDLREWVLKGDEDGIDFLCTGCLDCQSPVIMPPRKMNKSTKTIETQEEANKRHMETINGKNK